MKHKLVHTEGSTRLLLVFAGWGMDDNVLGGLRRPGYDVMVVWDYRSFHIDWACVQDYEEICLLAWSMGVYAASETVQAIDYKITCRVAVNGTMCPVDDRYGIPVDIFEGTLRGLSDVTLRKFFRRMCASREDYALFEAHRPARGVDELRDELQAIADRRLLHSPTAMRWDVAVAAREDRIFPFDNQCAAWRREGVEVAVADGGHFFDFSRIVDTYFIDKALVSSRFSAGTSTYNDHAAVQIDVVERLMARMRELNLDREVMAARNTVLEIGSGSGMLTRAVASLIDRARFLIWDISAPMPALPPGRDYEFVNCDAELAVARLIPQSVDAVFSASTIQWFNSPAKFFRDCHRAMRPGAYAFITTYVRGNMHQISDITGNALPLPPSAAWQRMAAEVFEVADVIEYERDLDFATPLDVLRHLKLTGVNALSRSSRGTVDARTIMARYPMMLDGRYHLTYKPLILILKKK